MEWVALLVLALCAALALPVGAGALFSPVLALGPPLVIAALAFDIVFVALDDPRWPAWVAFGTAVAGTVVIGVGARVLVQEDTPGGALAEHAAGASGAELPLLATAALLLLGAALGVTTVG